MQHACNASPVCEEVRDEVGVLGRSIDLLVMWRSSDGDANVVAHVFELNEVSRLWWTYDVQVAVSQLIGTRRCEPQKRCCRQCLHVLVAVGQTIEGVFELSTFARLAEVVVDFECDRSFDVELGNDIESSSSTRTMRLWSPGYAITT